LLLQGLAYEVVDLVNCLWNSVILEYFHCHRDVIIGVRHDRVANFMNVCRVLYLELSQRHNGCGRIKIP
jgi:hypothetical protein